MLCTHAVSPDLIQFDTSAQPSAPPASTSSTPTRSPTHPPSVIRLPEQWNVDDVCRFLADIGLSQYSATFRENAIDGVELLALTDESLRTALKVGEYSAPYRENVIGCGML